jgi:FkbM family methyltransferase
VEHADGTVLDALGERRLTDLTILPSKNRTLTGPRVRQGDIVLDAGANVGVFTRKALWAGAAKVIAIEPGPENLECLRRNFAAEIADGRVVLYPKGIWDKDDVLKLSIDPVSPARDSFVRPIENAQVIEAPLIYHVQGDEVMAPKPVLQGGRGLSRAEDVLVRSGQGPAGSGVLLLTSSVRVSRMVRPGGVTHKESRTEDYLHQAGFVAVEAVEPGRAFF